MWPLSSIVKIDDTPSDIAEGIKAGSWTIAVALSGNARGLGIAETTALSRAERAVKFVAARDSLRAAGASDGVNSLADCPPVLEEIVARTARGERPPDQRRPITSFARPKDRVMLEPPRPFTIVTPGAGEAINSLPPSVILGYTPCHRSAISRVGATANERR